MAAIVPASQEGLPPGVSYLAASIVEFPEDWRAWRLNFLSSRGSRPDFLLLSPAGHAVLVSGLHLPARDLAEIGQLSFSGVSAPAETALREAAQVLAKERSRAEARLAEKIHLVLILTAVRKSQLPQERLAHRVPGVRLVTRDEFNVAWLEAQWSGLPPLSPDEKSAVHLAYIPEAVIPPTFAARSVRLDLVVSGERLGNLLLDTEQENWVKNELALPETRWDLNGEAKVNLLTGVAGCGKSLLLLYRALLEARLNPTARMVFITHNRPLVTDLKRKRDRLLRINPGPSVEINTFYGWCVKWAGIDARELVEYESQKEVLRLALGPLDQDELVFFRDEFNWIKDQGIRTEVEYLRAERRGRVYALRPEQRSAVYEKFQRYEGYLSKLGKIDWAGRAARIYYALEEGKLRPPAYDRLFIDEAQFFAATWLKVLRQTVQSEGARIFIAADPTQGFLQRRQSWGDLGYAVRGRSTRLRRAYRSTRSILLFAREFFRARTDEPVAAETELNLPGPEELAAAPQGEWPRVVVERGAQDEVRLLTEMLRGYGKKQSLAQVLVLCADGRRSRDVVKHLASSLAPTEVIPAAAATSNEQLRVCSLDKATGLEAAVVIIVGLRELLETEKDPRLSENGRAQLREENSKKIYMGITRAGQQLVLLWSGAASPPFPEYAPNELSNRKDDARSVDSPH